MKKIKELTQLALELDSLIFLMKKEIENLRYTVARYNLTYGENITEDVIILENSTSFNVPNFKSP